MWCHHLSFFFPFGGVGWTKWRRRKKNGKITEKGKLCGGFEKCRAASTCQRRLSLDDDDNRPPQKKNEINFFFFPLLSFWHRVGWRENQAQQSITRTFLKTIKIISCPATPIQAYFLRLSKVIIEGHTRPQKDSLGHPRINHIFIGLLLLSIFYCEGRQRWLAISFQCMICCCCEGTREKNLTQRLAFSCF